MKKSKVLYMIPSLLVTLLIGLFPILLIMKDINKIKTPTFGLIWICYLILLILFSIWLLYQLISLIVYVIKSDMKIPIKILWIFLLLSFNILIIPYFYIKYINQDRRIIIKSLIYLIPIIAFSILLFIGLDKYKVELKRIDDEKKAIEAERNTFNTKDGSVSFTFRHGYAAFDKGEYDLYVKNDEEKVVFTVFTYNTEIYKQQTSDEFLEKGINDTAQNKQVFELYEDKMVKEYDDKVIKTVSYKGKTESSAMCIYKISIIEFRNVPNYLVYTVEIVTEKDYKKKVNRLDEILVSAKKN